MPKLYYRGEMVFLYVKFYNSDNQPAKLVDNPMVRILHESSGNIYEDLSWEPLINLSNNEYYLNYTIDSSAEYGLYHIVYKGEVEGKEASIIESFHVIAKSEEYKNAIKLYGYINDIKTSIPLDGVSVEISTRDGLYHTTSYTHNNGYWESYIYPGEYICRFYKDGFKEIITNIQVGNENSEIQFNNISMESNVVDQSGNGIYEIKDIYTLKNGIPLDGLEVSVYNLVDPKIICATTLTDSKGEWILHLDSGYYFLKVKGNSMNQDFDKTFRLKIQDDGEYFLEDMDENRAIAEKTSRLTNGDGLISYTDNIVDRNGNPIIDVQVVALQNNSPIAECYTDATGKFEFNLNSGEYYLDIYHPMFNDLPLIKINI